METQSLQLVTRCEPRSTPTDNSNLEKLIKEWIVRFSLNAGVALDVEAHVKYRTLWLEGFSDLAPARLQAAFVSCIRAHPYPKMPTVADVRQHLTKAEGNAVEEGAAKKFEQVLAYAVRRSPDFPEKNPPRISERTRRAINAAGGLDWIRDCSADELQWARKRFIEAYVRYTELQQDEYLLADGEIKNLLADAAQTKALPAPEVVRENYEDMRARGLAYSQELVTPKPRIVPRTVSEPVRVVDVEGRRRELARQAELIKPKYSQREAVEA